MKRTTRYPELAARLESLRDKRATEQKERISWRKISQTSGVDYAHVYRVFHGQSLPSRDILLKICRSLQCSQKEASEIFALTDHRVPSQEELDEGVRASSAA